MKNILYIALSVILLSFLFSCSDSAETMFDNAQFEELQNNPQHAREIYEELISKYPQSGYARKAEQRLKEIETSLSGTQ